MFSPDTIRTLAALGIPLDDIAARDDPQEHPRPRDDRDSDRRDGATPDDARDANVTER